MLILQEGNVFLICKTVVYFTKWNSYYKVIAADMRVSRACCKELEEHSFRTLGKPSKNAPKCRKGPKM